MAQRDLHNIIKTAVAFPTQEITTDTTTVGYVIDTQGYDSTEFVFVSGTLDATIVLTPTIQQADDVAFTVNVETIAAPWLIGTTNVVEPRPDYGVPQDAPIVDATFSGASLESNRCARMGVLNKRRYTRVSIVSATTTTTGTMTVAAILGHPHMASTPKGK